MGKRAPVKASPASKKPRLDTPEAKAKQKLRENYADLSEYEKNVLTVEGLTLYDTVLRDVQKSDAGDVIAWGKWYHDTLRKAFRSPDSIHKLLKCIAPDEVCPKLMTAMAALKDNSADRGQPLSFIDVASSNITGP